MTNKKFVVGIFVILFVFIGVSNVSAQTKVADLGDVRIYYYGLGSFGIESDRVGMCLPLTFNQSRGWIEIACSSEVVRFSSGLIGDYVGSVVKNAFALYLTPVGSYVAGEISSKVASWAASKGINYLCNL